MADRGRRRQAALAVLALLLLNAPLLVVVDRLPPADAPATPAYLFLAWGALIALCALNARKPRP